MYCGKIPIQVAKTVNSASWKGVKYSAAFTGVILLVEGAAFGVFLYLKYLELEPAKKPPVTEARISVLTISLDLVKVTARGFFKLIGPKRVARIAFAVVLIPPIIGTLTLLTTGSVYLASSAALRSLQRA